MPTRAGRAGAVAVPAAVMFVIGLWGIDRGGMWRDEGVTFQVARRSLPEIWRLLHGVDAVHGLYYLLMHAVLALPLPGRPGEVVLRLPSVCAAAATAALVAALGVRLGGRLRVGLWAGLLYAATPLVGHFAQEGRSYALVSAGVAGATLLLVRAVGARGRAVWWGYGGVVAGTCVLHEMAVLVVCAHGVTLLAGRASREVWLRWACAAGGAGAVLPPLVWVSRVQAGQVGWLPVPGWGSAERVLRSFVVWPTGVGFWACVGAMTVGVVAARRVSVVALPLLVVPPGLLMLVSQVRPLYDDRYVLYALAGAPLLVAAGADRVVGAVGVVGRLRLGPRARCASRLPRVPLVRLAPLAGVLVIALGFVHHLPLHRQDRTPETRADDLAAVSALAARQLRPGDPVLFLPSIGRRSALAYPGRFRRAWDIALGESGARSGTLYGREVGAGALRHRLDAVDRVWVVAEPYAGPGTPWYPRDPTERVKVAVVGEEFVPAENRKDRALPGGVTVRLYVRRAAATGTRVSPPAPPSPSPR